MIKTVTLSGTEVAVDGLNGFHTVVHNMSAESVYASRHPNIAAGADDVAEIPAGAVKLISTTKGKVYLVGNGKVELTGQDDGGAYIFSAASGIAVSGSGVTEQFVTEQDALNLKAARSYADSILEEAKNDFEQQLSQSSDRISQIDEDISALRAAVTTAESNAETALDAVEDIAAMSIVSEAGAFDLRYNDDKLQAKIGGNWSDITTGVGEGGVSQAYVDAHDAAALTAAKEYADTVTAGKADKPINAFVLIETVNWESDDNTYPYYYNIPIDGVTSADRAEVFFAANSGEAAKKCGFSAQVTTLDSFVQIRAKNIPETILSANVQIGILSATNTLHSGTNSGSAVDSESVEKHNADPMSHSDLRAMLNELKGRIVALEAAAGGDITANTFAVTFGDLDDVIADGVWVPDSARLEF